MTVTRPRFSLRISPGARRSATAGRYADGPKACEEVGYHSWATAEVDAGGEEWLMDVSRRMDKILELG